MANAEAGSMKNPKGEVREGEMTVPKGWGVHDRGRGRDGTRGSKAETDG